MLLRDLATLGVALVLLVGWVLAALLVAGAGRLR